MDFRTPRTLRRPMLAILPIVAVAFAACGSSDDAEFIDGYNKAVAPLNTLMTDISPTSATEPAAARTRLVKLADGLDQVRTELGALEPPADAADELDRMLTSLDKGTDQVRAMAAAAEDGDLDKLTKATTKFSKTGTDLVTVEAELRAAVEG